MMDARELHAKLEARVERIPFHSCWEWIGSRNGQGYAVFSFRRDGRQTPVLAHRLAVLLDGREVPPGWCVCHSCDNRGCVRPEHLFVATPGQNNADRARKGRTVNRPGIEASGRARRARRFCQRGHDRSDATVYVNVHTGANECRICRYEAVMRHRAKTRKPRASKYRQTEHKCVECGEMFMAAKRDTKYCPRPKGCDRRARRRRSGNG